MIIIIRGSSCREILSALPASELRHFQTPLEILTITPDSRAIIDPIVCLLDVLFSVSCATSFVILSDFISGSSCQDILSVLPVSVLRQFQLN